MIDTNYMRTMGKKEFFALCEENYLPVETQRDCLASLRQIQIQFKKTARYDDVRAWHYQRNGGHGFPPLSKSIRAWRGR